MSVRPSLEPQSLAGTDGELISVTITVEPRLLEKLLDTLASVDFPINPELYHDAANVGVAPDGSRTMRPAASVKFPAWTGHLAHVRTALIEAGFPGECLSARRMLDEIRANVVDAPAPAGAPYRAFARSKQAPAA